MIGITQYGVKIISDTVADSVACTANRLLEKIAENGCEVVKIKHKVTSCSDTYGHITTRYTTFITYKTTSGMTKMPNITLY